MTWIKNRKKRKMSLENSLVTSDLLSRPISSFNLETNQLLPRFHIWAKEGNPDFGENIDENFSIFYKIHKNVIPFKRMTDTRSALLRWRQIQALHYLENRLQRPILTRIFGLLHLLLRLHLTLLRQSPHFCSLFWGILHWDNWSMVSEKMKSCSEWSCLWLPNLNTRTLLISNLKKKGWCFMYVAIPWYEGRKKFVKCVVWKIFPLSKGQSFHWWSESTPLQITTCLCAIITRSQFGSLP